MIITHIFTIFTNLYNYENIQVNLEFFYSSEYEHCAFLSYDTV